MSKIITRTNALELAERVLRDAKGPLHWKEASAKLTAEGYVAGDGVHVHGVLHYAYHDTLMHGTNSRFRFVGGGRFTLAAVDPTATNVHRVPTGDARKAALQALKDAQKAAQAPRVMPGGSSTPAKG